MVKQIQTPTQKLEAVGPSEGEGRSMSKPDDIHLTVPVNFEDQMWRFKVMAQIAWDLLCESTTEDDDRVRHVGDRGTVRTADRNVFGRDNGMTKPKFPPRGNYTIPERTDYVTFRPKVGAKELAAVIKRSVDWARMCIDNGRPDLADNTLRSIWSMADATEQTLNT